MNGKQHFWLFIFAWCLLAIIGTFVWGIYIRMICAILLLPFFNPDSDLMFNDECHRWFFTHSLLPTTLFWYCIQPALIPEYQYHILLIIWFYPWTHLIGDLKITIDMTELKRLNLVLNKKAYGGTWPISFLPRLRLRKKKNEEGKELDLQWIRFSLKGSWAWLLLNIIIGIVGMIYLV